MRVSLFHWNFTIRLNYVLNNVKTWKNHTKTQITEYAWIWNKIIIDCEKHEMLCKMKNPTYPHAICLTDKDSIEKLGLISRHGMSKHFYFSIETSRSQFH